MAISVPKPLISLLLALIYVSSALATSDVPFIVAHKKATLNRLKSGAERVSVSFDIYNQGTSTVYDVSLVDDHWPKDKFDVVSGNVSQSWERLDAGGLLSLAFELEGKVKGMFYSAPAVITFRVPTKADLQEAFSTPILPLDILADRVAENKLDLVRKGTNNSSHCLPDLLRLLAKYGSLVSVISIVVLFVYLVSTPSKSSAAKKKR
ncbi:Translocon-associated protein subunit beta [Linum grandiflorum]